MSQEMVPEESVRVQNRSMREYGHLAARFATGWSTLATGSVSIYNFSEATAYRLAGEVSEGQQYLSESSNFAFFGWGRRNGLSSYTYNRKKRYTRREAASTPI